MTGLLFFKKGPPRQTFLLISLALVMIIGTRLSKRVKASQLNDASYEIPVLVLSYFPVKSGKLDPSITGLNWDLAIIRNKVANLTIETTESLNRASRYHGFKDGSAEPSLKP